MNQIAAKPASNDGSDLSSAQIGYVVVEASARGLPGLAVRGMLLTVVTLGLYRFWYITHVRRYFWSQTRIGKYPLEFTGQPVDLIVGFFMAVAVLLPLYLGLFVVSLGLQNGVLAANVAALFLLWFLSQFGLYRARNYRLTRTVWRGLRFRQTGTGISYALLSMMWFAIGVASLGLLWPLRRRALWGYRIRHTCFGEQKAGFSASLAPLIQAGWPLFLGIFCIGAWTVWQLTNLWQARSQSVGILDVLNTDFRNVPLEDITAAIPFADLSWIIAVASLAFLIVLALAGPHYLAAETRHFSNATSFGSIRLKSQLTRQQLTAVWGKFLVALAAFGFLYLGVGAVLFGAFLYSDLPVGILDSSTTRFWFFAALFLYYIIGLIGFAVLHLVFLRFQLWQVIGNSLSILPIANVSHIAAGRKDTLRRRDGFGEGIADALDAGGV